MMNVTRFFVAFQFPHVLSSIISLAQSWDICPMPERLRAVAKDTQRVRAERSWESVIVAVNPATTFRQGCGLRVFGECFWKS